MVIHIKAWMECTGFEWDDGNSGKNWKKHRVADFEAEEIFFNRPFIVRYDAGHSSDEENRWRAFCRTDKGQYLFVAFTVTTHANPSDLSARDDTTRAEVLCEIRKE